MKNGNPHLWGYLVFCFNTGEPYRRKPVKDKWWKWYIHPRWLHIRCSATYVQRAGMDVVTDDTTTPIGSG